MIKGTPGEGAVEVPWVFKQMEKGRPFFTPDAGVRVSKSKELAKSRWAGLGWGLVGWAQRRARAWGKGWKEARSTLVLEGSLEKAHRCSATFFPGRAFLVLPDQSASDMECSEEN